MAKFNASEYKGMKTYQIKRIIIELYSVNALSKEDAKLKCLDPHTITVVKEIIKLEKPR